MNVLLINPSFNRYGGIKGHGGSMLPLNLCSLVAWGRTRLPSARFRIVDADIRGLSHEDTAEEAARFSPDVIGITANTCAFDSVIALAGVLKGRLKGVPLVIGGPHPSALPETSLTESGADFAVVGEGEITFEELLSGIMRGEREWGAIKGLAYRAPDGSVRVNPPRPLIKDLDTLPFPARDLVETSLYVPPPTKRVSLTANTLLATSRGCAFNCGFCGAQTVWGRRTRGRSPALVVDEMEECVRAYGIGSFHFTDEFFTAKKSRVMEICRLMLERRLRVDWVCSARAQDLDLATLEAMKEAGCAEISFGIESGSPEILREIDKSLKLDEAVEVVRLAKKAGIKTHASYILGYIKETEGTIRETISFSRRLNTDVAAFFVASPLPGTRLYEQARSGGYLRKDATWRDYSPLSNTEPVMTLPGLSHGELRRWHRKALRGYYLRPGYVAGRLASIRGLHDLKNLLDGFRLFLRIRN